MEFVAGDLPTQKFPPGGQVDDARNKVEIALVCGGTNFSGGRSGVAQTFGSGCVDRVELIRHAKLIEFSVDQFIGLVVFVNDVGWAWFLPVKGVLGCQL